MSVYNHPADFPEPLLDRACAVGREHGARRLTDRMIGRQRLDRENVDRRLETSLQHEVGERIEVDYVCAADQNQHRVRLDLRQKVTRE